MKYTNVDPTYFTGPNGQPLDPSRYKIQELQEVDEDFSEGVKIDYKKYFTVSEEALLYIFNNFSDSEVGKLMKLPMMNKTYSAQDVANTILWRTQRSIHTKDTLRDYFLLGKTQFNQLFRKLLLNNILFVGKTGIDGVMTTVILLNPYFTKKTRTQDKFLKQIFKPLKMKDAEDLSI